MKNTTKFIGLDVSKEKIAVGIADAGREAPRFWGNIRHTREAVRKLMEQLGTPEELVVCYEVGPTGYELQRWLDAMGIDCTVIAPSLIPTRAVDQVKTDRRDALRLAQLHRAGELTAVSIPTEEDEALRDLVRVREDAKEDLLRARHRLSKFLLRHDIQPHGMKNWSTKHRAWLKTLKFEKSTLRVVFEEYMDVLGSIDARIKRIETEIHREAVESEHAPVIQALQTLRGVAEITATTLVAEIGSFLRFPHPRQMMAYAGLVPRESSTGESRWQGEITKMGNAHVRRVVVEAAWSYRYKPALKGELLKRQEGQPATVREIAWKAQERLHKKYFKLLARGKGGGVVAAAVLGNFSVLSGPLLLMWPNSR